MSSLAATQADGYYVPVEYYESGAYKRMGKNTWQKKQEQQRRQQQKQKHTNHRSKPVGGQQHVNDAYNVMNPSSTTATITVRFEMPDAGHCTHCHSMIGRGTRFNATKRRTTEQYFTTIIWEFVMTCRSCSYQSFVIRTDPAARGFTYVSGIVKRSNPSPSLDVDSMMQSHQPLSGIAELEQGKIRQQRRLTDIEQLQALQAQQERVYRDDAVGNAHVRQRFRCDRQIRHRQSVAAASKGWHSGMILLDDDHGVIVDHDVVDRSHMARSQQQQQQQQQHKSQQMRRETWIVDQAAIKSTTFGNGRDTEQAQWHRVRTASIFQSSNQDQQQKNKQLVAFERQNAASAVNVAARRHPNMIVPDSIQSAIHATIGTSSQEQCRKRGRHKNESSPVLVDLTPTDGLAPTKRTRKILHYSATDRTLRLTSFCAGTDSPRMKDDMPVVRPTPNEEAQPCRASKEKATSFMVAAPWSACKFPSSLDALVSYESDSDTENLNLSTT